MEALMELCDLVGQKPAQFADKLAWICNRCPSTELLLSGSPRVSRSQLNAVLAAARISSICPDSADKRSQSLVVSFLRSIPSSFSKSFWPQSFGNDLIASFFGDLLRCVSEATRFSGDLAAEVEEFMGEVVMEAIANEGDQFGISKLFLIALAENFPPISQSDGEKLVECLLELFPPPLQKEQMPGSAASSVQSSPMNGNHSYSGGFGSSGASKIADDAMSVSSRGSVVMSGSSVFVKSSIDQLGFSNDGGGGASLIRQLVAHFEEESLERQEVALKLLAHIVDKVQLDSKLVEQVRQIGKRQLQLMPLFLKIRKRDWKEQGTYLKSRVNAKLLIYKAAANLQSKSIASLDSDGKTSKRVVLETIALLIDAAEACLLSVWRKLRTCEDLFSYLLAGVAQVAVTRGGQPLRVLLIRLKPLVLTACAQCVTDCIGSRKLLSEHNHVMDDESLNVFFNLDDLKVGNKMLVYFSRPNSSASPPLLPRKEADSIPFSSSKLGKLLEFFSLSPHSAQAKAMSYTLEQCELETLHGESKFCATSLEAMLDYARGVFGLDASFKVLTTALPKESTAPLLQNYAVLGAREVRTKKMIGCHTMPFPYAIYYCHSQESRNKVFEVSLGGDSGDHVEAVAACHMDTSMWDRDHVAFRVLGIEPGSRPVCHFFPADNLVWVASSAGDHVMV